MVNLAMTVGNLRSIFIARLFLILFLPATLLSSCDRSGTPASTNSDKAAKTPDGTKHVTLERFETKQGTFELGMAPCTADGCAFEVRWLNTNKLISSIALPVHAANQVTEKEATSLEWGADAGLYAWGTGEENNYVSTVARPITLDTDTVGLLVTQRLGFEHIKRLHQLVVPKDGQLVLLWEFTEAPGYIWSAAVDSLPAGFALFYVRYHVELSEPDIFWVARFTLNKDKGELVLAPEGVVATALVVGDFMSPNAAYRYQKDAAYKQQKSNTKYCFSGYDVYSSNSIKAIPKGHNALVRLFAQREQAEEEKKRLFQCGVSFKMSVVDILTSSTLKMSDVEIQSSPAIYKDLYQKKE